MSAATQQKIASGLWRATIGPKLRPAQPRPVQGKDLSKQDVEISTTSIACEEQSHDDSNLDGHRNDHLGQEAPVRRASLHASTELESQQVLHSAKDRNGKLVGPGHSVQPSPEHDLKSKAPICVPVAENSKAQQPTRKVLQLPPKLNYETRKVVKSSAATSSQTKTVTHIGTSMNVSSSQSCVSPTNGLENTGSAVLSPRSSVAITLPQDTSTGRPHTSLARRLVREAVKSGGTTRRPSVLHPTELKAASKRQKPLATTKEGYMRTRTKTKAGHTRNASMESNLNSQPTTSSIAKKYQLCNIKKAPLRGLAAVAIASASASAAAGACTALGRTTPLNTVQANTTASSSRTSNLSAFQTWRAKSPQRTEEGVLKGSPKKVVINLEDVQRFDPSRGLAQMASVASPPSAGMSRQQHRRTESHHSIASQGPESTIRLHVRQL